MKLRVTHALMGIIGAAALALTGCAGQDGTSCTVTQTATGARISCDDGTSVNVDNGTDGAACTAVDNGDSTSTITCEDGTSVVVTDGTNGTSCTVTEANGVKTIKCADGTSVTVRDGIAGETGGGVAIADHHGEAFLKSEGEFALSATNTNPKVFVKPTITSVTADEAGKLVVNFKVDTLKDQPYKILSTANVGIAKLVPANGTTVVSPYWVSYLYRKETVPSTGTYPNAAGTVRFQATRESAGTGTANGKLINNGDGTYRYEAKVNLATALRDTTPVGYDRSLTHRVTLSFGGHSGPTGNVDFDFVPAGGAITTTRNLITTQVCQNCHGFEFHGHGGDRLTMENCVTCHNPGNEDANGGESIDMAPMIHKIHAGGELPSVAGANWIVWDDPATVADESADNGEYAIWGNGNTKHEWWEVEFPAVIENCTACHQGTLSDVDNWKTKPSIAACGSCHDNIDFATGAGHSAANLVQADDSNCDTCHPATGTSFGGSVVPSHDWVAHDLRKQEEFNIEMALSTPANTKYFDVGEKPVLSIVLKRGTTPIDHTTVVQDAKAEDCTKTTCPQGDGLFRVAMLYVEGPRAFRRPALTTQARAQVLSSGAATYDLTTAVALKLVVDQGEALRVFNKDGTDKLAAAAITVNVANGVFVDKAVATLDEIATWLNADAAFKARAIAAVENGKISVRSRGLGKFIALQLQASDVATVVFGGDLNLKVPGNNSNPAYSHRVENDLRKTAGGVQIDPKVTLTAEKISYQLDGVDDLEPGTYVAYVEIGDIGNGGSGATSDSQNFKTPSVAKVTFQVKQEAEEKLVADSCDSCHLGPDGKGYVLDYFRHNKKFDNAAIDGCASCHDYQPSAPVPGSGDPLGPIVGWAGSRPISRRVHAVHFGSSLNYPHSTVGYPNGDGVKGRNWQITYPMDVRNCESCHSAATSGTWKSNPSRLACGGCHDADAATVHMRLNTVDPTPANPFSGDEQESCAACHK